MVTAHTGLWPKTARNRGRLNLPTRAKSLNCRSWADCITVTSGTLPERAFRPGKGVDTERRSGAYLLPADLASRVIKASRVFAPRDPLFATPMALQFRGLDPIAMQLDFRYPQAPNAKI